MARNLYGLAATWAQVRLTVEEEHYDLTNIFLTQHLASTVQQGSYWMMMMMMVKPCSQQEEELSQQRPCELKPFLIEYAYAYADWPYIYIYKSRQCKRTKSSI